MPDSAPSTQVQRADSADSGPSVRITLTATAGPHKGRVFTFLGHDNFIVGRSRDAHFQLPIADRYFSRIHFMVEANPTYCRLLDMGSRNGTYLNGAKVTKADLKHGDCIKAGRTLLRVAVERPSLAPAPSGAAASPDEPQQADVVTRAEAVRGWTTVPPALTPLPVPVLESHSAEPPGPCRVCAGPKTPHVPQQSDTFPNADLLCPACREAIRNRPQPVAGYQIVRELGKGGMGVVYLALRTADAAVVALKMIIPTVTVTEADVQRFLREARILRQLVHPYIVAFREMSESEGRLFFAMDYVPGTDANRLVKSQGPLPIARAVGLVCQLLEALEFAHARGFVHRDIKPGNLLVTQQGGQETLKLADFGLARVYEASKLSGLTMDREVAGTVAFLSPEQITHFREVKPATDQYAAAATLYTLLTDRYIHDFPEQYQEQLLMILHNAPVAIQRRRADIPRELALVIHRALAKGPEKRFGDVGLMRAALQRFCD